MYFQRMLSQTPFKSIPDKLHLESDKQVGIVMLYLGVVSSVCFK